MFQMQLGRAPAKLLLDRSSTLSCGKLQIASGMLKPESARFERSLRVWCGTDMRSGVGFSG